MGAIPVAELEQVRRWYYNEGLPAGKIAERLGVSLDAVYYFMRHNGLPRRTLAEENTLRFARKPASFSVKQDLTSAERELKALGIALYWGEGAKFKGAQSIDFANSDPVMIGVFLQFLRTIFVIRESKFRIQLYCYANQNTGELIQFWSTLTGIPKSQFIKPYVRQDFRAEKAGKMRYGLIHVRYCDKKLLLLILDWIKEYGEIHAQVVP